MLEQRYQAVSLVVNDGESVVDVARRFNVSRQTVHAWLARYEKGGLPALADRSHRPKGCASDGRAGRGGGAGHASDQSGLGSASAVARVGQGPGQVDTYPFSPPPDVPPLSSHGGVLAN